MAQYLCPMETIYTPQGDGNPSLSEVQPYLRRKQSTPRKGTETYEEGTEIAEWNAKQSTPRKGTETGNALLLLPYFLRETIYTPQGDGNCALSMSLWLCVFETIYTPQGDGKPLIIRVAYTTARSTLRPVRGRKRKRNCFLEIEHTKTPQGDNFHQRSVMCFERSQRARLLWLPAARHR